MPSSSILNLRDRLGNVLRQLAHDLDRVDRTAETADAAKRGARIVGRFSELVCFIRANALRLHAVPRARPGS